MGLGCALALTVLLTGNVAAYQLVGDERGHTALVTPTATRSFDAGQWLRLKLATPAGRTFLVY